MNVRLRLTKQQLDDIHRDLDRPHSFAAERVGFLNCGAATLSNAGLLLLAQQWLPVDDMDYLENPMVGASIGPSAFRKVLQIAYQYPMTILHVHRHEHSGAPRFSRTDEMSMRKFVPGFFHACQTHPHGALVLSRNSAFGALWLDEIASPVPIQRFEIIGSPIQRWGTA